MTLSITTVSGDYAQGSFGLLPLAGERVRAALYFSRQMHTQSFEQNPELARRYLRAALSEFRSVFDLVEADFRAQGLSMRWKKSSQKELIEKDPVIAVLRKVRDFAIHSASISGQAKTFKVTSSQANVSDSSDLPAIVIEPLDRKVLAKGRGKDELKNFDDDALDVFNKHAARWPADLLVQIAIFRASEFLASFLSVNQQNES